MDFTYDIQVSIPPLIVEGLRSEQEAYAQAEAWVKAQFPGLLYKIEFSAVHDNGLHISAERWEELGRPDSFPPA